MADLLERDRGAIMPLSHTRRDDGRPYTGDVDFITVECTDGERVDIDRIIASQMSVAIRKKLETIDYANSIIQADNITGRALLKVMEYCHMHTGEGKNMRLQDLKQWDEKFVRLEPGTLCELASAAYHLEIKPLVDLTCQAIAQLLKGKSPAEIRRTFNILYDFNPEDDAPPPTMRDKLRNKLCNPSRREKKNASATETIEDTRSVDELLSFINDEEGAGSKSKRSSKAAKRARQRERKKQKKNAQRQKANDGGGKAKSQPIEDGCERGTPVASASEKRFTADSSLDAHTLKVLEALNGGKGGGGAETQDALTSISVSDIKEQVKCGKLDLSALSPDDDIWSLRDEEDPELDKEVEAFRKRLEAVNKGSSDRQKMALASPISAALVKQLAADREKLQSGDSDANDGVF